MLAADFAKVGKTVDGCLSLVSDYLGLTDVTAKLPVLNKSLSDTGQAGYLVDEVREPLVNAVKAITDATADGIRAAIYGVVGPSGLNVLKDTDTTAGIDADDVAVTTSGDNFTVTLSLLDTVGTQADPVSLGTGLKSVPLTFDGGTASVTPLITAGYDNLTFGWANNAAFFGAAGASNTAGGTAVVNVAAKINAGDFNAQLGLYPLSGTLAADNPSALAATFNVPVGSGGSVKSSLTTLSGHAHLEFTGTSDVPSSGVFAVPDVKVRYIQDQDFGTGSNPNGASLGAAANKPAVAISSQVSVQKLVAGLLLPIADKLDTVLKPIEPVVDALSTPLPVLSQLSKAAGGDDVSLLDVAKLGIEYEKQFGGDISEDTLNAIEDIVSAFDVAKQVIDLVHALQDLGTNTDFYLDYGSFDLSGSGDLRDPAIAAFNPADPATASLTPTILTSTSDFKQQVIDALKALPGDSGKTIADFIQTDHGGKPAQDVSYDFQMPLFESPASIDTMLLGGRADLITFAFDVHPPEAKFTVAQFQAGPIKVEFDADLIFSLAIHVGYDSNGLRTYDVTHNPGDQLQGLYFGSDTAITVGGGISAKAGIDVVVFSVGVEGGIDTTVSLGINTAHQTEPLVTGLQGTDNDPTRVRQSELLGTFLDVNGKITGHLDVAVKIGVKVPFVGFVGYEDTFNIASGTIFSFDISAIPDPFSPPDNLQLATFDPTTGLLGLAGGDARTNLSPQSLLDGQKVESFNLTADPNDPNSVIVSAYGFSQTFHGVSLIIAEGNNDKPLYVTVDKSVTADVQFTGGGYADRFVDAGSGNTTVYGVNGDDELRYTGSGNATIYGGDGNDIIAGGSGQNVLSGDNDNDQINVGKHDLSKGGTPGLNVINGGSGNDTIAGGLGNYNYIAGELGDDAITAGDQGDLIYADILPGERPLGAQGNDTVTAGKGNDSVFGGGGDDQLNWQNGDGGTAFQGEAGNDSVAFLGSGTADVFSIASAKLPQQQGGVDVYATAISIAPNKGVLYSGVENLDLEGLGGADTINVPDLSATGLTGLTINTLDVAQHDNAVDNVTFAPGGNGNHAVNVYNEGVGTQQIDTKNADGRTIDTTYLYGGVTKVLGLAAYSIRVGNVGDSVVINTGNGNDNVQVYGISGPTKIYAQGGNDTVAIAGYGPAQSLVDDPQGIPPDSSAQTAGPTFAGPLLLDAGTGAANKFVYGDFTPTGTSVTVNNYTVTSPLIPGGLTFVSTGGKFGAGGEVDTGDGNDTITVLSTMADGNFVVNGGGGDDLAIVESTTAPGKSTLSTLGNGFGFQGGTGKNEFRLDNSAGQKGDTNVLLSGNTVAGFGTTQQVIAFASTGGATLLHLLAQDNYSSVEHFFLNSPNANVRIDGQGGNDIVEVYADTNAVSFNGGAGLDYLGLGKKSGSGYVLSGVTGNVDFDGGDGKGDELYVADTIGTAARVYAMAADSLKFSGVTVTIKNDEQRFIFGGNGSDRLVMTGLLPATTYAHWYGGGGSNDLTGSNFGSAYRFTGFQAGQLNKELDFRNVATVHTGTGSNTLAANDAVNTGLSITSSGADVLDYSLWKSGVTVDLSASNATGFTHVFGVPAVIGSNYSDLIRGDLNNNTLLGNGGNDILIGMEGNDRLDGMDGDDILIGGIGADTFNGGANVDLLIDGTTAFDNDNSKLKTALFQWTSSAAASKRPLPGVFSGAGKLVHDNQVDSLSGGAGSDTFYIGVKATRQTNGATDFLADATAADLVLT